MQKHLWHWPEDNRQKTQMGFIINGYNLHSAFDFVLFFPAACIFLKNSNKHKSNFHLYFTFPLKKKNGLIHWLILSHQYVIACFILFCMVVALPSLLFHSVAYCFQLNVLNEIFVKSLVPFCRQVSSEWNSTVG